MPAGRRARATAAAAALALGAAVTPAHADDVLLKDTVIVGTLASWTVAFLSGAPVSDCLVRGNPRGDGWGLRVQQGTDKELRLWSVGAVRRDCHLTRAAGFDLDVAPVASIGHWDASATYTQGLPGPVLATPHETAWDTAFVPMLHWKLPMGESLLLDTEVGAGPAWFTRTDIGTRQKSTHFQFSDHLGVGLATRDGHWRLMAAYRHVSNADIKKPNNAVDFKGVVLEWTP